MSGIYILDEYEYFDIKRELEAAQDLEDLKRATLKLLECLPVRYSGG